MKAFLAALLLPASLAFSTTAIDIGSRVEMFVDEHLIESKRGAALKLNPPIKREVVITLDQPWEGPTGAYYTVFADQGKIRLYYRGAALKGDDNDAVTCYAESTDGIHFARPELGLVEFNGSKSNNIIFRAPYSASFAPFRDTNPASKPEERYKALCYEVRKRTGTMSALASPDGIHWKPMTEGSIVPRGSYDSLNVVSWDERAKKYLCFNRYWDEGEFKGVRAIESRTSDDFVTWSEPTHNVYAAGVPREHFYTSATTRCPGAEHMWLSFPMRLVPERKKVATHKEPAVSDAVFMSSRDGAHWDRPFLEAWIRPDRDKENWTDRNNMPAWGIIETPGRSDEFSMYVSEHYRWPTNRLRRVTIRKHGFASMNAGAGGGEFVTKTLKFTGNQLLLNYATSAAGSVQVELQNDSGQPLAGFAASDCEPIYGDELDHAVKWKGGDISAHAGKPIRVRFMLKDADIYAFRFNNPS
jgi:hypothetical protein